MVDEKKKRFTLNVDVEKVKVGIVGLSMLVGGSVCTSLTHDTITSKFSDDAYNKRIENLYERKMSEVEKEAEKHFELNQEIGINLPSDMTPEQAKKRYIEKVAPAETVIEEIKKETPQMGKAEKAFGYLSGVCTGVCGGYLIGLGLSQLAARGLNEAKIKRMLASRQRKENEAKGLDD